MKARITDKSELTLSLLQHFTFDILDDDDNEVLTSQSIECMPSQAVNTIKTKIAEYQTEYELSQEIPTEIE